MKILLASHRFFPDIGGIEGMSSLLAQGFLKQGHEVIVVTQTPYDKPDDFPFQVVRAPSRSQLLDAVRWSDVFFHNNISLQTVWPLLLVRRPWVVAHRTWIARLDGSLGWQDRLKHLLLRFSTGISISQAVADHLSTPSTVIGNPYRDDIFFEMPEIERDRDLVFLGRLVSDKGIDLLLQALEILGQRGLRPNLTIIGSGPEESALRQQVDALKLGMQVEFVGPKSGAELTKQLNGHRIMVVPSKWKEPFGIVALEGAACGCVVVGSEGGGLKDAIGISGLTFPNGDVPALAARLEELLSSPARVAELKALIPQHLQKHTSEYVVDEYLKVITGAARAGRPKAELTADENLGWDRSESEPYRFTAPMKCLTRIVSSQ